MIEKHEVHQEIRQYILEATLSNKNDIQDETLLFEQGFFDSMGLLFLVDFIRDTFDIDTKDDELIVENFESINCIVAFVIRNLELKKIGESIIYQE